MRKHFIFLLIACITVLSARGQIITTIAGNGENVINGDGGPAISAGIGEPLGLAVDDLGNVYFATNDTNESYVRKVSSSGIITTIAGGGMLLGDGGPATLAQLGIPSAVAVDRQGNVYISEFNSRIRKVNTLGIITTIAGTGLYGYNGDSIPATSAQIYAPRYLAVDKRGNVYVSDYGNSRIRKIDTTGFISTVAGTGILGMSGDSGAATLAQIAQPLGIAVDSSGVIYFADGNDRIRKVDLSGVISTFAGYGMGFSGDGGLAIHAEFNYALDVAADDSGNVYVVDNGPNNRIRKVNKAGIISTIAGNGIAGYNGDGRPATATEINGPLGVAVGKNGSIYISDAGNHRIRAAVSPLSVPVINDDIFKVYPNPNKGFFTIYIPANESRAKITVMNAVGEKIMYQATETNKPIQIVINVPPGVYFMQAATTEHIWNKEIVVSW